MFGFGFKYAIFAKKKSYKRIRKNVKTINAMVRDARLMVYNCNWLHSMHFIDTCDIKFGKTNNQKDPDIKDRLNQTIT